MRSCPSSDKAQDRIYKIHKKKAVEHCYDSAGYLARAHYD